MDNSENEEVMTAAERHQELLQSIDMVVNCDDGGECGKFEHLVMQTMIGIESHELLCEIAESLNKLNSRLEAESNARSDFNKTELELLSTLYEAA